MVLNKLPFEKFKTIFYPKHIAFIGASERSKFGSMLYLSAFKESVWAETFYPVNPKYQKLMDWNCYASVLDIPFQVDTAYISVKTNLVPKVLKECVEKEIPWVIIFSSGFSETGDPDGLLLERKIISVIKGSKTRVVGPNCLGPFNSSTGMAFSFSSPRGIPGSVSFMSQSGGHLNQLIDIGFKRDIRYRYGISFGNQIDLNSIDFLRFFKDEEGTRLIAAYLESFGSGNGHDFYLELKEAAKRKPVIIWKGGYTDDGARAAYSHTGAIVSDMRLWKAISNQTGAVIVDDNENFWNTIKTFELLFPKYLPKGRRVGVITPGGGSSVNTTDLLASRNLSIPELTSQSQEKISEILPKENVNIKNPVDLGALGFVVEIFIKCIEIVIRDPNVDIIVIPLWPHFLYNYVFKRMIKVQELTSKPIAFVLPSISDSLDIAQRFNTTKKTLHKEKILYYFSLSEAAKSLSLLCDYSDFLKRIDS